MSSITVSNRPKETPSRRLMVSNRQVAAMYHFYAALMLRKYEEIADHGVLSFYSSVGFGSFRSIA